MKKKKIIIVTGCLGLVGFEACNFFSKKNFKVVGIDNNYRKYFFGVEGSNLFRLKILNEKIENFEYYNLDIRSYEKLNKIFKKI